MRAPQFRPAAPRLDAPAADPVIARIRERLRGIGHLVAVISGKGGVGKSYITASLALSFARRELEVGVLDADVHGPTVASMLDAKAPLAVGDQGLRPSTGRRGVRVVSTDLLPNVSAVTRPASSETLRELLADSVWGALRVLLVDMPPDAERIEELTALVPRLSGVLAVTLPTEESRRSVEQAMRKARDLGLRLLGVVENMSGIACEGCGVVGKLFEGNAGQKLADTFGVPLLARLPFSTTPLSGSVERCGGLADSLLKALA